MKWNGIVGKVIAWAVVLVLFGGLALTHMADTAGAEITCPAGGTYDGNSEQALLEGVTAMDARDGDLSAQVAIESIAPMSNGDYRVVYYVIDSDHNVTKAERTVSAVEQQKDEE